CAGGAIFNVGSGTITVTSSSIINNHTCSGGTGGTGGSGHDNGDDGRKGYVGIGGAVGSISDSTSNYLNFNRIIGNSQFQVQSYEGWVDATLNWWGSNDNPDVNVEGNVSYDPWIILTIKPTPNPATHIDYNST